MGDQCIQCIQCIIIFFWHRVEILISMCSIDSVGYPHLFGIVDMDLFAKNMDKTGFSQRCPNGSNMFQHVPTHFLATCPAPRWDQHVGHCGRTKVTVATRGFQGSRGSQGPCVCVAVRIQVSNYENLWFIVIKSQKIWELVQLHWSSYVITQLPSCFRFRVAFSVFSVLFASQWPLAARSKQSKAPSPAARPSDLKAHSSNIREEIRLGLGHPPRLRTSKRQLCNSPWQSLPSWSRSNSSRHSRAVGNGMKRMKRMKGKSGGMETLSHNTAQWQTTGISGWLLWGPDVFVPVIWSI